MTDEKIQHSQVRLFEANQRPARLVRPLPEYIAPSLQFVSELRVHLLALGKSGESRQAA
jgi:hypothetical protein